MSTFILSVICMYFAEKKQTNNKIFLVLAMVIPSITAAFRQSGIDYDAYKYVYTSIKHNKEYGIEIGWILLNKISPTYEVLLFLSAALFFSVVCFSILKLVKKDVWIAWYIVLVVCYGTFCNATRQMLAVAFVFLAVTYLLDKKHVKFLVMVLCAVQFHKSAIFMIVVVPIYLLISKRLKNQEWLIIVISIMCLLGSPICIYILNKLDMYTGYLNNTTINVNAGFLLYMLPPLWYYYKRKYLFSQKEIINKCVGIYLLAIPFQLLGWSIAFADRVMLYFQIFISVIVPMIISNCDNAERYKLRCLYIIWFSIHYIVIGIIMNGNGCYPYRIFEFCI